ncbi:hypothetical protein NW762_009098 [Fusarium torreyae]|uniref:C2H2-type domain-containing protein n=1 Tax=Fusarium torreyae TaxID=1237075 RepID=A0A9W8VEQ5_9HYPO|nr:hypothetical protein NW762_009098 [Fusarium torreyae]
MPQVQNMDHFMKLIHHHLSIPVHETPSKRKETSIFKTANPIFEVQGDLEDRKELGPFAQNTAWCDGSQCQANGPDAKPIIGIQYSCIDCPRDQTNFCSACIELSGQGIDHDRSHRLLEIKPTVCAICQDLLSLEVQHGDFFRGPYRQISASAITFQRIADRDGCVFCSFAWKALKQYPPVEPWPPAGDETVTIRWRQLWRNCCQISVVSSKPLEEFETEGGRYIHKKQNVKDMEHELEVYALLEQSHKRPVELGEGNDSVIVRVQRSSGSKEALELIKMWFQNCRETHTRCHDAELDPRNLPIRVLDLHGLNESRVYLRNTSQTQGEYAALSYCWGPGSPGLFTTAKNVHAHQDEGIEIGNLPATIRDTINVTKELGIRYLWVDRLCIIQDSTEDWTQQAALMCQIYSGAAVTLSADGSKSAADGLFCTSQTLASLEYKAYQDPKQPNNPFVLHQRVYHSTQQSRSQNNTQPIDQRGWTMQERLTSRRVLHFTTEELVWECRTLLECECRRQSHSSPHLFDHRRMHSLETTYDHWRSVVSQYTKRVLSEDTDKLPALRGLVTRFQELMSYFEGGDMLEDYLAGLWRGDLVAQLAWKAPSDRALEVFHKAKGDMSLIGLPEVMPPGIHTGAWNRIVHKRKHREGWHRAKDYIAPSWSWAQLHGPVTYLACRPHTPFISYVDIVQAKTVPRISGQPTGQVISGHITMSAFMVKDLRLNMMEYEYDDNVIKNVAVLTNLNDEFWIEFRPDDAQKIVNERGCRPSDIIVLMLGTKDLHPGPDALILGISEMGRMEYTGAKNKGDIRRDVIPVPGEIAEAFHRDHVTIRWVSFLVVAASKEFPGKYERLGCFDAWGPEVDVMAHLFVYSVKGTIIVI